MRKLLFVSCFVLANFCLLVAVLSLLWTSSFNRSQPNQMENQTGLISTNYESYSALPQSFTPTEVTIIAGDSRSILIDNFLKKYHSPMTGVGADIVTKADQYQLPFGLLPAIAQCEGNLGKVIPEDSFNSWGWAIYGDTVTKFKSWQDGIEKVSSGLRKDYFNEGLSTPEQIMKKYTPNSKGSWADCVDQFLQELR